MKPYILLLVCLVCSAMCGAQNYKCVRYGDTAYFINIDGYLRGMRIDEVVPYGGGDTLLVPFSTQRHVLPGSGLDATNGSWLGSRIMDRHDGFFTFNTIWNDTVYVQTQAMPGDTWDFYNDGVGRSYKATVTSIDTMTVMGVLDSIKTIVINAYVGGVINPSDTVNGFEMILSKDHGFVQAFDLYCFPYRASPVSGWYSDFYQDRIGSVTKSKMRFVRTEFHVPTKMEVYDFNEGDVFVTSGYTYNEIPELNWLTYDSIMSRTIVDAWHVRYKIFRKENWTTTYHPWGEPAIIYHSYSTDTLINEFDTSKLFEMLKMPEENPTMPLVWHYRPTDSGNCFKSAYYKWDVVVTFEGGPYYAEYKQGFEQISYGTHTPPRPEDIGYHSTEQAVLVFSVKSGVPCGVRTEPNGVEEVSLQPAQIHIYPNPAQDELYVSAERAIGDMSITDMAGRVLYRAEQLPAESRINVSGFAPGVYLLRVNGVVRKFVKQ